MAITETLYTGNNATTIYAITFPYIADSDIKVTLNGVLTTAFVVLVTKEVQFAAAPNTGVAIRIFRETDDLTTSATFFPGSSIRAEDLNDNFTQGIYIAQESRNKVDSALLKAGGTMTGPLVFAAGQSTATTSTPGIVQLNNSVASTSQTQAATPSAVKTAYDEALAKGKFYEEIQTASNSLQLDFTIPSWTKQITVAFYNVDPTTNTIYVRLGDVVSGVKASGYSSYSQAVTYTTPTSSTSSSSSFSLGFAAIVSASLANVNGHWTISSMDSNIWMASSSLRELFSGFGLITSIGSVTLAGTINSLRVIPISNGTFSGSVAVRCVGI